MSTSPSAMKRKWVIVILGFLGFVGSFAVVAITFSPVYLQATTGGIAINPLYVSGLILTFIIGLAIYIVSYAVRKSRGIDLELAMKEIPPE